MMRRQKESELGLRKTSEAKSWIIILLRRRLLDFMALILDGEVMRKMDIVEELAVEYVGKGFFGQQAVIYVTCMGKFCGDMVRSLKEYIVVISGRKAGDVSILETQVVRKDAGITQGQEVPFAGACIFFMQDQDSWGTRRRQERMRLLGYKFMTRKLSKQEFKVWIDSVEEVIENYRKTSIGIGVTGAEDDITESNRILQEVLCVNVARKHKYSRTSGVMENFLMSEWSVCDGGMDCEKIGEMMNAKEYLEMKNMVAVLFL